MYPLLEFQDVSFNSEDKPILQDVSFRADSGDFISIVGTSGSGKSTLLKLCSHLISPSAGNLFFEGKNYLDYNPVELRKSIIYCFQTPYLFGKTVMDNIAFPFSIRNVKPDLDRIHSLFDALQMPENYLQRDVKNLSGGEKQRIALIRSIVFKPRVLLLDEITSALDVDNTQIVEKVVASLNAEGVTVMWISHNPEQSRKHANKILTIESGKIKSFEVLKKCPPSASTPCSSPHP